MKTQHAIVNLRLFSALGIGMALLFGTLPVSQGAALVPTLSLVNAGTAATAATIPAGTLTFSLDLRVDTGGLPVSGLQYYFVTSPVGTLRFSTAPVTALNAPFTASDLFVVPVSGALLTKAEATTVLFKLSAGDYPAISGNAITRYTLNTSSLSPGSYVITPVGEELTNANTTVTTFGPPGSLTLTVQVPEPGSALLVVLGGIALLVHRRVR